MQHKVYIVKQRTRLAKRKNDRMKKTMEQLEAYRIVRQELQNTLSGDAKKDCQIYKDLWYLDFMEKGGATEQGD